MLQEVLQHEHGFFARNTRDPTSTGPDGTGQDGGGPHGRQLHDGREGTGGVGVGGSAQPCAAGLDVDGQPAHAAMNYDRLQLGVFRVNCVDCLDRTNVAQSVIALGRYETIREYRREIRRTICEPVIAPGQCGNARQSVLDGLWLQALALIFMFWALSVFAYVATCGFSVCLFVCVCLSL